MVTPEQFPGPVDKIRAELRGQQVEVGTVCAFDASLESVTQTVRTWEKAAAQHVSLNFSPADGRLERMRTFARAFSVSRES